MVLISETDLRHQYNTAEILGSFSPGDSFFLGLIFFCPVLSFVVLQWRLCSYVLQSAFSISFSALLPQLSKFFERRERFFSRSGRWVVTLWLISGWGEVKQEQPCSAGSLPAWTGRESHQLAETEAEEQGRTVVLVWRFVSNPKYLLRLPFFSILWKAIVSLGLYLFWDFVSWYSNLDSWQLLKFGFPLHWALFGVLMCYKMNEDHVLMSAGVTESQNTARVAAFPGSPVVCQVWKLSDFVWQRLFDNSLTEPTPFLLVCDYFLKEQSCSAGRADTWMDGRQLVLCVGWWEWLPVAVLLLGLAFIFHPG